MRTLLIFTICLCLFSLVNAQSIEQQTLSSIGISQDNTELTVGEAIIYGNQSLTQGFHQGKLVITHLTGPENPPEVKIFPNPTFGILYIDTQAIESVDIRIFDSMGKNQYLNRTINGFNRIDIQSFPAGNFILILSDKKGIIQSYLIQKTN